MEIKRGYHDFQDTENWLNEMAGEGKALTAYKGNAVSDDIYTFELTTPNEYIHRILVLDNNVYHKQSLEYMQFLEDTGIEIVGKHGSVVFLRKKAVDGPFEIYTDKESLIKYYKSMAQRYIAGLAITPIFLAVLIPLIFIFASGGLLVGLIVSIVVGTLFSISMDIKFIRAIHHYFHLAKRLESESIVQE